MEGKTTGNELTTEYSDRFAEPVYWYPFVGVVGFHDAMNPEAK